MKNVLAALVILLFSSLAANAGETVVPKGLYNTPGHMNNNPVKMTNNQMVVTGTFDREPTKDERELLLKRLNFCSSDVCRKVLAWVAPASAESGEFARGSAD